MFFTSGIVLLTLIINGTTTGMVIRKLGLAKENEMSKRMLRQVLAGHNEKTEQFITNWKKERSEHGDKDAANVQEIDLVQLKKHKAELIEDLRLHDIEKKYKKDFKMLS